MPDTSPSVCFLIGVGTVFVLLVVTAIQSRRHARTTDRRQCAQCGATNPAPARFCRQCGKPLS